MKIRRTLPPAAAPIDMNCLLHSLSGMVFSQRCRINLEKSLKSYFGMKHVFPVSSGKAALMLILKALRILAPDKNEVLIPAYTCFSVPSAIVRAGLKVSLCDIDPSTFDFDYSCLKALQTDKTLCIVPSHLFGIPSDMDRINLFAKERGLFVVEDAAQAMGGLYRDRLIGTIGDAGFFSLGRGKNVTCMSGGVIVTNDDGIAAEIKKEYDTIKSPGVSENVLEFIKALLLAVFIRPSLYWLPSGLTFLGLGETIFSTEFPVRRLSGAGAGLMWHWQHRLEQSNRRRKENGEYLCKKAGLKDLLKLSVPFLRLPYLAGNKKLRDNIYSELDRKGLGASLMYPSSINEIAEIKDQFTGSTYPSAEGISSQLLTIPTHELLTESDLEAILESLATTNRPSAAALQASPAARAADSSEIPANGRNHV